jgi:putative toxin-antitoxin system antitoxin component (TIGR02293 family)
MRKTPNNSESDNENTMPEFLSEEAKRVIAHAESAFEDKEQAAQWLRTPNRVLDGRTPLELLATAAGAKRVDTVLGRIEWGIYS